MKADGQSAPRRIRRWPRLILMTATLGGALLVAITLAGRTTAAAPHCPAGRGRAAQGGHHQDMQAVHYLFAHRQQIRRTVKEVPGGVETVTESDDPEVAGEVRRHVAAMYQRVKEGRPIHARDPLFAELFANAAKIDMKVTQTARGVKVVETSTDPYVSRLIRRHAEVVSAFLANGHQEMMRDHPLPEPPQ